ncbi:MAG TPA: hypothetical protein VFF79_20275 [Conexibacter sp.]|nr:hypothetical protein [Conexibacter sp.]
MRTHAPAKTDRAAAIPGPAVAAIDQSPIRVDRGPIPTATGIAHQLGWLEREAALDGTPLTVGGGRSGAPLRASLLRAAAPPRRPVPVADIGRHLDPAVRTSATTPAAITVDADLLAREPNLVVRLLAVLLRAGAWAQLNAPEATELLALETGTAVRDVIAAHGRNWPDQLHVDLSQRKLDALRAQHDFLVTHGFLARSVDVGAWIDPRPLAVVRELLADERTAWV